MIRNELIEFISNLRKTPWFSAGIQANALRRELFRESLIIPMSSELIKKWLRKMNQEVEKIIKNSKNFELRRI